MRRSVDGGDATLRGAVREAVVPREGALLGVLRSAQPPLLSRVRGMKNPLIHGRRCLPLRTFVLLYSAKQTIQCQVPAVMPRSNTRLGGGLGESQLSHPSELSVAAAVAMETACRTAAHWSTERR